jgi:hypothetical protein
LRTEDVKDELKDAFKVSLPRYFCIMYNQLMDVYLAYVVVPEKLTRGYFDPFLSGNKSQGNWTTPINSRLYELHKLKTPNNVF